ncbi:LPD1 domain-containing protein [Alkanindiges hydrocarboniclasticus]|nr:LPD1 domain-containing protein [Alkanindiges hydrocarboniclasticus]
MTQQESKKSIQDLGEKFGGARKDEAIKKIVKPVARVNPSAITKKSLWPRPDFRQDALEGRASPASAILYMTIYDNLAVKPHDVIFLGVGIAAWQDAYKAGIRFIREAYEQQRYLSLDDLTAAYKDYFRKLTGNQGEPVEMYGTGKRSGRKINYPFSLSNVHRIRYECLPELGWPQHPKVLDTDCYGTLYTKITGKPVKMWYAVRGDKSKAVLISPQGFGHRAEAMALAKREYEQQLAQRSLSGEDTTRIKQPVRPVSDQAAVRKGRDWRKGVSIDPNHFMEVFRFRGVEFGNWVTQAERQGFLDATYDALMDLTELCGLPPSFASLGGRLGIAFGSRGSKTHAAHFERARWLMHLSKSQGVGALAHEFGHALDAFLASRNKVPMLFLSEFYLHVHGGYKIRVSNWNDTEIMQAGFLDRDMMPAYHGLMQCLIHGKAQAGRIAQYSQFAKSAAELDALKGKPYWNTPTELFARVFETWVIEKLKQGNQVNDFLVYGIDESEADAGQWGTSISPYPLHDERQDIIERMDNWMQVMVEHWQKRKAS